MGCFAWIASSYPTSRASRAGVGAAIANTSAAFTVDVLGVRDKVLHGLVPPLTKGHDVLSGEIVIVVVDGFTASGRATWGGGASAHQLSSTESWKEGCDTQTDWPFTELPVVWFKRLRRGGVVHDGCSTCSNLFHLLKVSNFHQLVDPGCGSFVATFNCCLWCDGVCHHQHVRMHVSVQPH